MKETLLESGGTEILYDCVWDYGVAVTKVIQTFEIVNSLFSHEIKLLQRFINNINQEADINNDLLHWMANEAMLKDIHTKGYEGDLIIDEMSI